MKKCVYLILLIIVTKLQAQNYTLYSTGSTIDTITKSRSATLLMGGASENDEAMKRFLRYADGGDIVVIRTSGADGYNAYFYSQLGVYVHSVKTFVINTVAGANDSTVVQAVRSAEAVWIAGGNQYNYVQYWRGTALNTTLNTAINTKRIPIGGTSAGMAIQGSYYFSAQNGSVTSATALANPYDATVTIDHTPFLNNDILKDLITDTHFDNPDRKGRLMTFLARTFKDEGKQINAIACEEYTAVWVDSNQVGYVFGTDSSDHAYFITIDCEGDNSIENCTTGTALNWNRDGKVVKVYDVVGNNQATGFYDLNNFKKNIFNGGGGTWQDWSVDNGVFKSTNAVVYNCATNVQDAIEKINVNVYPNPAMQQLIIENNSTETIMIQLQNIGGKTVAEYEVQIGKKVLDISTVSAGVYCLQIKSGTTIVHKKIIVQ